MSRGGGEKGRGWEGEGTRVASVLFIACSLEDGVGEEGVGRRRVRPATRR